VAQDTQEPETAQTLTVWLGNDDQQMYRELKADTTVDDTLSSRAKGRIKDGLVIESALQSRALSFESDRERRAWLRQAVLDYED